ncbi:MAG: 3-keto-5-aminohexanoate cleavage protein [Pseudomonadota bacterium]
MKSLPRIMVAPNGARLNKADHPALPVTIEEIVQTAKACHAAGADGLHAHVRDANEQHVLDVGLYRELQAEMRWQVPDMLVQITTEAVSRYTPETQMALVKKVRPQAVSVAFRELAQAADQKAVRDFYRWARAAGIAVQHILYDQQDLDCWARFVGEEPTSSHDFQVLLVLGSYSPGHLSVPEDLSPMLIRLKRLRPEAEWAVCAFGPNETACLKRAFYLGGKARIGFENNMCQADGTTAANNAARVAELVRAMSD